MPHREGLFDQTPTGTETSAVLPPPAVGVHRDPRQARIRRIVARLLAVGMILTLALTGTLIAAALLLQHRYDRNIERFGDPFRALPNTGRPPDGPPGAENILLLGSDSRISARNPKNWVRGAEQTDAVMIAHIPADRSSITFTSIPRNSRVAIPGHGTNRITASYGFGGPTLIVQTVEGYTHVRIDHLVIVDFAGFKEITDTLGGVKITVPPGQGPSFPAGTRTMNGTTALAYVRQQYHLPGGDYTRVKRQQSWLRAVAATTLDAGTLTHPLKINAVLGSLTRSIATDDAFSIGAIRSLAVSLRSVRGSDLRFLSAPVAAGSDPNPAGDRAVVLLDQAANRSLWKAVADDTLDTWLVRRRAG